MSRTSRIVVGMTGAAGLSGGIARANLNALIALTDLVRSRSIRLEVLSLHERREHRPGSLSAEIPFRAFEGSVAGFSLALAVAARPGTLVYLDHVGLAGPVLPAAAAGLARTVIFAHGWEAWGPHLRSRYVWSFRTATLVLTNSSVTLRKMRDRLPAFAGETCLLGLAPDFPLHAAPPAPSPEPIRLTTAGGAERTLSSPYLLMVARMSAEERQKGHLQMLDAWPSVARAHPDARLVFAGTGDDLPRIRSAARDRGLDDAVVFAGRVDDETLQRLYSGCTAFVMPSTQEGFGLVYLEAMNWGKACLGCRDQGTEDVIDDGVTGLLIRDPDNRDELASALLRLLDDPSATAEMGRRGFERLRTTFTAEHAQRRLRERLEPLL